MRANPRSLFSTVDKSSQPSSDKDTVISVIRKELWQIICWADITVMVCLGGGILVKGRQGGKRLFNVLSPVGLLG